MANKPKTPGEVAWEAYISTLVETPDRAARGGYSSSAWEAAAQAVRKQQLDDPDITKLEKLRLDLSWWWIQDWAGDTDMALSRLLDAVGPFMPDESDEPKPEAEAECAENAGAEPSKSPPPAKR